MTYINESQEFVISKFLKRYDYDGVLDILISIILSGFNNLIASDTLLLVVSTSIFKL